MTYAKYLKSFELIQAVADVAEDVKACTAKWDELFTYVHANFSTCSDLNVDAEVTSIKEMFDLSFDELKLRLHEIPPTILEECFPVWAARYLLMSCGGVNACISIAKSTTFSEFCQRYSSRIGSAYESN